MSEPRVRLTKVSIYTFVLKPTFSRKELLKCNKKHFEHWKCCKTANLSWSSSLSEIQSCIHFRRVLSFLTSRKRTLKSLPRDAASMPRSTCISQWWQLMHTLFRHFLSQCCLEHTKESWRPKEVKWSLHVCQNITALGAHYEIWVILFRKVLYFAINILDI